MKDDFKKFVTREESGLVVAWFDVAKVLIFTALMFILIGPLYDNSWMYMHHAYNTTDLYTQSDVDTLDSIYNFIRLIPMVALGVVIYYVINYSNLKRDS